MRIQFINHASVKLITARARITTDPWYAGAAFNNGWDLIRATPEMSATGADATHIWLSHEHPDHFSIPFFKSTPNRALRILFQDTADRRVASFLRGQGFEVDEISEGLDFPVAEGETIRVGRNGFYDSWSLYRAEGLAILNLNDCELNTEEALLALATEVGPIDVLLTQFSYAAWKGGRGNKTLRESAAREKLATVQRQIKFLKPKFVIPFASFVYFSNVENFYLNDSINDVASSATAIESAGAKPVIMKPLDQWIVGAEWDNSGPIAFWQRAYANLDALPKRGVLTSIALADLALHCRIYQDRVFKKNSKWLIRLGSMVPKVGAFRPLTIRLTDLGKTIRFSFFDMLREVTGDGTADVEMSSESLDFIFLNEFGYDTLTVNGRFEATPAGFSRMTKNFAVGSLNALGLGLKPSLITNADVVLLLVRKLRSFVRKMNRTAEMAPHSSAADHA